MVKVTIENDKNKDEITGEFFMGLMLTKEEKTEDSTTYKACAIGTGNTCVQDIPNNVAKWIVSTFGAVYKTKLGYAAAMAELAMRIDAAASQTLKESAYAIADEITEELKGGGKTMTGNIKCEILETFIEFPEIHGYHLELNLIEWGDNEPKYDLRRWNEDRSRMTKGITLSKEELLVLQDKLSNIKF